MAKTYKPTDAMAAAAERGLRLRKEYGVKAGTSVGLARARDLMNKKNLSEDTVMRMHSFFSRHEDNENIEGWKPGEDGYPAKSYIAFLLWGGRAGKAWAERHRNAIVKERGE